MRNNVPFSECTGANQNPYNWNGSGEFRNCNTPPQSQPGMTPTPDNAAGGSGLFNNGQNYPVQADLQGQYHNEIVGYNSRPTICGRPNPGSRQGASFHDEFTSD